MRYLKDIGFVIKRVNVGEADRYVTLFAKQNGKIELMAKGVRRITSRRASYMELLNLISFQAVKTRKNYILTEVETVNSFQNVKKSLNKVSALFLICELVDKLCPYGQTHEDIFELVKYVVNNLQSVSSAGAIEKHPKGETQVTPSENTQSILFEFQIRLLTLLGYWDPKKRKFQDEDNLKNFIENVIEKKIKTKIYV